MIKKIIKEIIEFIKYLNDEYESKNPYIESKNPYIDPYVESNFKKYTDEY